MPREWIIDTNNQSASCDEEELNIEQSDTYNDVYRLYRHWNKIVWFQNVDGIAEAIKKSDEFLALPQEKQNDITEQSMYY